VSERRGHANVEVEVIADGRLVQRAFARVE
jgi:hypothetical protein